MPPKSALGRWLLKKIENTALMVEAQTASLRFSGGVQQRLQDVTAQLPSIPAGTLKTQITQLQAQLTQRTSTPPDGDQAVVDFWKQLDQDSQALEALARDAAASGIKLSAWADDELDALDQALSSQSAAVQGVFASELTRLEALKLSAHQKFNQQDYTGAEAEAGKVYHASKAAAGKVTAAAGYVSARDLAKASIKKLKDNAQRAQDAAPQIVRLDKLVLRMTQQEQALDISGALQTCHEVATVRRLAKRSGKSKGEFETRKPKVEAELLKLRGHPLSVYVRHELDELDRRTAEGVKLATAENGGYQKGLALLSQVEEGIKRVKALLAQVAPMSQRAPKLREQLIQEGLDPAKAQALVDHAVKLLSQEEDLSNADALKMAKDAQGYIENSGLSEPDALMSARVKFALVDEGVDEAKAQAVGQQMRGGGTADADDVKQVGRKLARMSAGVLNALNAAGTSTVACRGPVTEVNAELCDELPRGWPPGMTWDQVPGVYSGSRNEVVVGTMDDGKGGRKVPGPGEGPIPHGTPDLVGHEAGHAFDVAGGGTRSLDPAFIAARLLDCTSDPAATPPRVRCMVSGTDNYFLSKDEGGTNTAGAKSETFAESFAMHFSGAARWVHLEAFWKTKPFGI